MPDPWYTKWLADNNVSSGAGAPGDSGAGFQWPDVNNKNPTIGGGQGYSLPSDAPNTMGPANPTDSISGLDTSKKSSSSSGGSGLGAFGGLNIVGAIGGTIEAIEGQKGLDQLKNIPFPEPTVAPELQAAYGQAQDLAKGGYTAGERGAFNQNLAQGAATNQYNAGASGLGSVAQAGINAENLDAYDKFAAKDADLHRQNIAYAGDLAGKLQEQKNLITAAQEKRRYAQEEAYGGALQAGLGNIMKSFNAGGIGSTLLNAGVGLATGGIL